MLPERGCEIYEFRDRSTGVDVLFKSPWGLQPPGAPPREGSDGMEFLHNYGGGWQELLPSCNDACTYEGVELPFHGEVATVALGRRRSAPATAMPSSWSGACAARARRSRSSGACCSSAGQPTLTLRERVENLSADAAPARVGAPLRRRRAVPRGRLPAARAREDDRDAARDLGGHRATAPGPARAVAGRAAAGRRAHRPARRARARVPTRTTTSSSTDLEDGTIAVENPRLGRTFRLALRSTRCSAGWSPGSPTAARTRCRSRAPTRSASSPGSRSATSSRPSPPARPIELAGGASLETTLTAAIEGGPVA